MRNIPIIANWKLIGKAKIFDMSETKDCNLGSVIGSFITEGEISGMSVYGKKFIDKYNVIRTATKFDYDDLGIPYLWWGKYSVGCLPPKINLRIRTDLKWL